MFCIAFLPLQKLFPFNLVKVAFAILVAERTFRVDNVVAVVVGGGVLLAVGVVVCLVDVSTELTVVVALVAVPVLDCSSST